MSLSSAGIIYAYPAQPRQGAANTMKEHENAAPAEAFSFGDIMDIINPLQHIPVVSTLYRVATGDKITAFSRMVGGGLLGGPVGFLVSAINSAIEETTGSDMGEQILAFFQEEDAPADETRATWRVLQSSYG